MIPTYLDYQFHDTESFIGTFDEAPLWSAAFGLLLLQHLDIKPHLKVADLGSGAGFPLLELAGRMGNTCKLYGIDPWANANTRARQKIINYGLTNVEIIECPADQLPLEDESVDLVVSNLGINNFDQPEKVFLEVFRVLKKGGKLALTTNTNGHWNTFYRIFEQTLLESGQNNLIPALTAQEIHRGSRDSIGQLFVDAGLEVTRYFEDSFDMTFVDGTAFLNHYFVKLGWLSSWRDLIPEEERVYVFSTLEKNLNNHALQSAGLTLSVPMLFMEGRKPA
jgi:arsenite methyltransferase